MRSLKERADSAKKGAILFAFIIGVIALIGWLAFDFTALKALFGAMLVWLLTVIMLLAVVVSWEKRNGLR
jgi:hypothetical protein